MPAFHMLMAFVWMVVGIGVLTWHFATNDPRGRIGIANGISVGWLALLLGVYNLARWWASQVSEREKKLQREREETRRRRRHLGPPPDYENPNPEFDFTDNSSPAPSEPPANDSAPNYRDGEDNGSRLP